MYLSDLALLDFRSHSALVARLAPGVTTFVVGNGQGKTNLVEAVSYLATLSSHRVATTAPLIRRGAARAQIRAKLVRGDRSVLVDLELAPGQAARARVGKAKVKPAALLGVVKAVAFVPEDLSLVKGGPDERRRYLDEILLQLRPSLAGLMADYDRVSHQRAALLKSLAQAGAEAQTEAAPALDVWDQKAAELGGRLTANRMALTADLAPLVADAYSALASGGTAAMAYKPSVDLPAKPSAEAASAALLAAMAAARAKEIERGVGLAGPHRDDLLLELGGLPARGYASHGESWSLALGLRLAAFQLMRQDQGDDPVLILDDVFAELDSQRRQAVEALVQGVEQVLITAAVEADVPPGLTDRWYRLEGGQLLPADGEAAAGGRADGIGQEKKVDGG
ncbi:MAG: DNA replication/repair protein RecF [Bifidobacteriaceae bacterium]|jgi:DNA replication and repair protein RecF|nr:DNA replication/repair protein RecF [Bifidobacteriaceae bacterium]